MDLDKVSFADFLAKLSQRVDKRRAFNIADCAAKLDDADIGLGIRFVNAHLSRVLNLALDGVGNMRHNLDSLAEIIPSAFRFDDLVVDLSSRDVILLAQRDRKIALVVSEVKIQLTSIISHVDFPMSGVVSIGTLEVYEDLW